MVISMDSWQERQMDDAIEVVVVVLVVFLAHSGMAEDLSRCRRRVMSQSGIIETRLWRQTRRDFRG